MKKNTVATILLLILLASAVPTLLPAQGSGSSPIGTGGSHRVQGHIYLPSGRAADGPIQVKLQSFGAGDLSVMASGDGSFTFSSLAPGNYTVIVDAGKEFKVATESVFIDTDANTSRAVGRTHTVLIHLQPNRDRERDSSVSVVDVTLAAVPEEARKLYEKGLALSRAGDTKKAIDNFKSAVAQYPDFIQALDELGVQYLKTGQADKAAESLTAAVKLSPDAFRPNLNLGIALLEMKRFEAAESQLKNAIRSNAASPAAHMYLGIALIGVKKSTEAQPELEAAVNSNAPEVAKAHYYLGGIYWANREYGRAADELETYLKLVPKAPEADKVRPTIKELRSKH
jgi:cytochrome c-type biogenesis protein CcmH/NrfG